MGITSGIISYKNFGRVLAISNGTIDLYVTLDIGPRIIRYALAGGENFMFEDLSREVSNDGEDFDAHFYKGARWYIYGGHRIWLTPESMPETYYPDNEPVEYSLSGNVFTFTPPLRKPDNVAIRLIVEVSETGSGVRVTAKAQNAGGHARRFGLWNISVVCPNGLEVVPLNVNDTGLLSNGILSLWSYADLSDHRLKFGRTLFTLKQNPAEKKAFKIGMFCNRGFAAYLCYGAMFVKRFPAFEGLDYPDGGCNYETYLCDKFLEMESLGDIKNVAPGDELSLTEHWSIVPNVARPDSDDFGALEKIIENL